MNHICAQICSINWVHLAYMLGVCLLSNSFSVHQWMSNVKCLQSVSGGYQSVGNSKCPPVNVHCQVGVSQWHSTNVHCQMCQLIHCPLLGGCQSVSINQCPLSVVSVNPLSSGCQSAFTVRWVSVDHARQCPLLGGVRRFRQCKPITVHCWVYQSVSTSIYTTESLPNVVPAMTYHICSVDGTGHFYLPVVLGIFL